MDKNFKLFIGIMIFYALLSYIVFPIGFFYLVEKSLSSAGNGFVLGSIISLGLWVAVGRNMVLAK